MNSIVLLCIFAVCAYFLGNLNWAIIISKRKKTDIRKMGSGNPGTLNVSRNLGLKFGLLTFVLDILKGAVPTLIAYFVFRGRDFYSSNFNIEDFAIFLTGFFVVLGHIYPVIFKFNGGKGIASSIGVFLVTESVHGIGYASIVIMALIAAALFIYFTEFGAMGSFIAITPPAIGASIRLYVTYHSITNPVCIAFYIVSNMLILSICLATWFAHRKNIERMLAGEEHPTSIKEMFVKLKAKKRAENKGESEELSISSSDSKENQK